MEYSQKHAEAMQAEDGNEQVLSMRDWSVGCDAIDTPSTNARPQQHQATRPSIVDVAHVIRKQHGYLCHWSKQCELQESVVPKDRLKGTPPPPPNLSLRPNKEPRHRSVHNCVFRRMQVASWLDQSMPSLVRYHFAGLSEELLQSLLLLASRD
jgi:hypothetical protein